MSGLYAGFADLLSAGITSHMARIAAVQAAACDPIYPPGGADADDVVAITKGDTVAEGIPVAKPVCEVARSSVLFASRTGWSPVGTSNDVYVAPLRTKARALMVGVSHGAPAFAAHAIAH